MYPASDLVTNNPTEQAASSWDGIADEPTHGPYCDCGLCQPDKRVKCHYCGEPVMVQGDGTLTPHTDIYPTRWCEGGNRKLVTERSAPT